MVEQINLLLINTIAPSTQNIYSRAWQLFDDCMKELHIPYGGIQSIPLSIYQVIMFISYLNLKLYAPTTITTYISALSYVHKFNSVFDPTSQFVIQKLLAASVRIHPTRDVRLPITIPILQSLIESLQHTVSSLYLHKLFKAMFIVSFLGLMRVGEVTVDRFGKVALQSNQIQIFSSHVVVTICEFKHNLSKKPFEIVLPRQTNSLICPVTALLEYFQLRGYYSGPLFCFPNLTPISRNFFVDNLKQALNFVGLQTSLYKSHSFRIGGASYYASLGLSDEQIRLLGRWHSNAFRKYIQ